MYDAIIQFSNIARKNSTILETLNLSPESYLLATVHRPYNTDNLHNLDNIFTALTEADEPVVFPVHPRTNQKLTEFGLYEQIVKSDKIKLIEPIGYLDMLMLEQNARIILTNSGGIQKEAFLLEVPCITLRQETEWIETVESGWNVLAGADSKKILDNINKDKWPENIKKP